MLLQYEYNNINTRKMERKANSLFGKKIRKAKKGCLKIVGIQDSVFSYIVVDK